jgi:hypothetical protein
MADHAQYPIDVTELWGPDGEAALSPALPFLPADELRPVNGTSSNGNGEAAVGVNKQTLEDVARLADAIAANHSDVLRRADLDAMGKDLESAFTQQLAVALYELMGAWKSRFATAEEHISERVTASVETHTGRLASSMEASLYASLEMAEAVRSELAAFRKHLAGVEGLTSFQRDLRHEVARLGDLVAAPRPEPAQSHELGEAMKVLQKELAELREDISELRAAVDARANEGVTVGDV